MAWHRVRRSGGAWCACSVAIAVLCLPAPGCGESTAKKDNGPSQPGQFVDKPSQPAGGAGGPAKGTRSLDAVLDGMIHAYRNARSYRDEAVMKVQLHSPRMPDGVNV